MSKSDYITILLVEYKALRDESLRSAQILSNTVWIAVSGFIITIGALANAAKDFPSIVDYLPLLLSIQSFSATSMFLSETWKYARVGIYIREKIEKSLLNNNDSALHTNPMYWEHWITNKRATIYYITVLALLQLPVFATILIFLSYLCEWNISNQISEISIGIISDKFICISTSLITIIDLVIVTYLLFKIKKQIGITIPILKDNRESKDVEK